MDTENRTRMTGRRSFCFSALWLTFAVWTAAEGSDVRAATESKRSAASDPVKTESAGAQPHWSLQPLRKPALPVVKDKSWARTPIDRFILAKLEEKGLKPSPAADKRTLLRRIYFDLIGLPPTPQEMDAFLDDRSPAAYEKVVERLLSSPRYGERWARHWLDVVHYAETHGHDQDRIRTNAWPYRDYVITSFNQDKPYARFVEEQIAGDVLFPGDPQAVVAMGFLATGPWDESSLRDIRDDTIDRQVARYLDRDDIVTTVMNTFVSATVQCARCHNHKFDPISQEEYYGLQAVFAATDKADRLYDSDPEVRMLRQALSKQKDAIERKDPELLDSLRQPAFENALAAWEKTLTNRPVAWTTLEPISFVSSNGATLSKQPDCSILSSGKRPETDSYTITTRGGRFLTAVRLEVMTDDSLPHKGPGRQDNGNLHLTDFRVFASKPESGAGVSPDVPDSAATHSEGRQNARPTTRILLQNASADFNQDGWGIARAIDNDPKTAWGIYPAVGQPHQAVFELKEPLALDSGATLTFVLDQNHGGGHLIGRVRLSVTTNPPPVSINAFPDNVAQILATPASQRNGEQNSELALFYLKGEIERKLAALPKRQIVFAGASDFVPDGSFKPAVSPRPVHLLKRGDINKPGELAVPGALSCVSGLASRFDLRDPNDEGTRRAALARWITNPQNTLTWRSMVNRIWHYHFGHGIVDSPNDFGQMGGRPTHPELLDWLALNFLENGGSVKKLHRLIVTSAVYRQGASIQYSVTSNQYSVKGASALRSPTDYWKPNTEYFSKAAALDADNRYLWRMNRSRLDAESVRDAVLQISGKLDLTMGGPPVMQFALSPGIHVTPVVDYGKFDVDSPASFRRSIYRFIFRTLPDPFMDTLDCADSSQLTPTRNISVTALQALAMLNDHFIVRQSEHFAERVRRMGPGLEAQIAAAYQLALNRAPSKEEARDLADYARKHGLANLCRLIFNSNEFMFVN